VRAKSGDEMTALLKWAGLNSNWELVEPALASASRIYVFGPPGIGKSHLTLHSGVAVFQVTPSDDISVQELAGHYLPEGNVFRWHDGPVTTAARQGALLILNEITRASGAVQDFLLGILDSPEVAVITLPTGENFKPAKGFAVVATANTPPDRLDPALRSRFEVEIELRDPNPGVIARLNRVIAGLGDVLRDSFKDPTRALDPRKVLSFGNLVRSGVPPRQAAILTFGERALDVIQAMTARGVKLQ